MNLPREFNAVPSGSRVIALMTLLFLAIPIPGVRSEPARVVALDFDTLVVGATYTDVGPLVLSRQIALDSTGRVHMVWPWWSAGGATTKGMNYNSVFEGVPEFGGIGCTAGASATFYSPIRVSLGLRGTLMTAARYETNHIVFHDKLGAGCNFSNNLFTSSVGSGNPDYAPQQSSSGTINHILGSSSHGNALRYWRGFNASLYRTVTTVPAEGVLAISPVSDRVAIVYESGGILYYYESMDAGLTWGGGSGFGLRHDLGVSDAGWSLTAVYDYNDVLHIVYGAVTAGPTGVVLRHWSEGTGLHDITQAIWSYPGVSSGSFRNITNAQLAVGTGERINNLYLVWDQFGTALSDSDLSIDGNLNADIFLAISTTGGDSWAPPINLTNSSSPGCQTDCASEIVPSIANPVDSLIHLIYQRDLRAGVTDYIWQDYSAQTLNPVYYMRLHTPEPAVAPLMTGLGGLGGIHYYGVYRQDTILLPISNAGTAPLTYVLRDTMSWLSFPADPDSQAGVVPVGGAPQPILVTIDVTDFPQGNYAGTVFVESNDSTINGAEVSMAIVVSPAFVAEMRLSTGGGTDCWGWTGPDGREYALMGTQEGIVIVDATNLRVADTVPGPGPCPPTWRDMQTYRHYAYAVSECTGLNQGLMTIDLQYLPDSAHLVGTYTGGGITSHDLSIDTARGFAYLVLPNYNGFRIVSLANPESPVNIGTVATPGCHDMFARNDTVWVAEGTSSSYSIWNLADKSNPALLSRLTIPGGGFAHNIWPNESGTIFGTTEETSGRTVKFWDASDLQDIRLLGEYLGESQLAHDVHLVGHYAVLSHYQSGVKVLDLADPSQPVEIGAFDTYPEGEEPDFVGCWGVYPHTRSGRVYASNMDGKLFILQFDSLMHNCVCECALDPYCDGVHSDVNDVVTIINLAFRGSSAVSEPQCPYEGGDVDCSGAIDVADVVHVIDVAFRGMNAATEFCVPCP